MNAQNKNCLEMSKVIGKCPKALREALKTLPPKAYADFMAAYTVEAEKYIESCKRNPNPESSGRFVERNLNNLWG